MSSLFNAILGKRSPVLYPTDEALFNGLQAEDTPAIRQLYAQMAPFVFKQGRAAGLPNEDIEELIGDAIALFLLKIRRGQYVFQGFSPSSYAIEIAKNKMMHRLRAARRKRMETELTPDLADAVTDPGTDETDWAVVQKLDALLGQLPPNCRQLIRLKYMEEVRDKEAIAQQMTPYTTVDALKTHRYQCMKKLMELANPQNR